MEKITFQQKWANNQTYHGPSGSPFGPSPLLTPNLSYLASIGPSGPSLIALSLTMLPQGLFFFLLLSSPNNQPSSRHQAPNFDFFRPLDHPLPQLQHWVSASGWYHCPCHLQAALSSPGWDKSRKVEAKNKTSSQSPNTYRAGPKPSQLSPIYFIWLSINEQHYWVLIPAFQGGFYFHTCCCCLTGPRGTRIYST